jgi:hypothetical protein
LRDTPQFPLEPVCVMLGGNKLTSDRGEELKFWVHKQLAREFFHETSILFNDGFDAVDWKMVSKALRRFRGCFKYGHASRSWT